MQTFTFYSYKGGTGRSLLLANTARYLALLGHRVVALDFDFEAPGLHYKLNISPQGQRVGDTVPERGAVDYLLAAIDGDSPPKNLRDYLVPVPLPPKTEGALHLLPAGSAPTGNYFRTLTKLLHEDPFSDPESSGIAACLELQARIEEEFRTDFLLIDSRTGVTELAGITTTMLADKVVCLMLPNRESQSGARAVLRSLTHAQRMAEQSTLDVIPVLSRIPEHDESMAREALDFLNEEGPSPEDTLHLEKVFLLRTDPELARAERLHLGSGEPESRSPLHQDYLALMTLLVEADPEKFATVRRRQEAIRATREWLSQDYEHRRHRPIAPDAFREDYIDEGVVFRGAKFGNPDTRYADLVAYAGVARTEALLAVEYVEELTGSEAWKWWQDYTDLRCVILVGKNEKDQTQRRIFTRGRRGGDFVERDDFNGWAVRWPISFSALDDPGDRSVDSLLTAVQRGEDGFISLLVQQWQRASFVTLHGGAPYRPTLARQILDGLAEVKDVETEVRILWRTAPDPFERTGEGFKGMGEGVALEEMTTRELHAPLWWRLSVEAKQQYWEYSKRGASLGGIEMLTRDLLGLTFDPDRDFRSTVGGLLGPVDERDSRDPGPYRFTDLYRQLELDFEFSDEAPPELVRRTAIRQRLKWESTGRGNDPWSVAKTEAQEALTKPHLLKGSLQMPNGRLNIPTSNLLASYDPESTRVTLYREVIDACARLLSMDRRALANVVFLHEATHALTHLGRDLDGRQWEDFSLPSSRNPSFQPSRFHETIAQFFTHRLLVRLEDQALLNAFEKLSDAQPPEYQTWRKMQSVPVEQVRKILMRARAGLDDTPWGTL